MMEVILEFEGRKKILKLPDGSEATLRQEFDELCDRDPVLKRRKFTHYPTFKTFNSRHKTEVEIDPWDDVEDGQTIIVHFAQFAVADSSLAEVNVDAQHDTAGSSSNSTEKNNTADIEFLTRLGVHSKSHSLAQSTTSAINLSDNSQSKKTKSNTLLAKKSSEKSQDSNNSDEDNEYIQASQNARRDNQAKLRELNFVPTPKLRVPTKKSKSQGTGKENVRRASLPRAVKAKKVDAPPPPDIDNSFEVDDEELDNDQLSDPGPVATGSNGNIRVEKVASKRIKKMPKIRRRRIGERITHFTPLPLFPPSLIQSIESGLVYVKIKHTERMNNYLKEHVLDITKDLYPTKKEYKILKEQVLNRLKSMNAPNILIYKARLIKSLSACLRNARNYRDNKLPRRLAQQAVAAAEKDNELTIRTEIRALTLQEADNILKQPVQNKDTVRHALDTSVVLRVQFAKTHSTQDMIDTYPYLKEVDLFLYDYSTRVPLQLTLMEQNFDASLKPLSSILSVEEPKYELEKVKLLENLNAYFCNLENNGDHFPCIQLWDEKNNTAGPLNEIPRAQSPAVFVTVNDKDIVSSVLVFDGECLYTWRQPRAFQCAALLLAGYFVYQIEYPGPYKKQLYTLQHIIHGEKRSINPLVRQFFKTYSTAVKQTKQM